MSIATFLFPKPPRISEGKVLCILYAILAIVITYALLTR